MDLDELPLGRIASSDFAYCRLLDRMLMYERRIENSLTKMMNELKRQQITRQIEHGEDEQQDLHAQTIPKACGFKAATRCPAEKKGDLKKQSQFAPELMGTTTFAKGGYENIPAARFEENKAKQSQFPALE